MNVKKILISLAVVGVVSAVAVGGTIAFFSDTETSTGNTFAAGAIDLKIDNESYYNGVFNQGTSWELKDLGEGDFFFNFRDLKPGDWGEDTISLHVDNNDSWLCADVTLRSNKDNTGTEPEMEDEVPYTADDASNNYNGGELADAINFYWWADDGDNVYENGERLLPAGPLGVLDVDQTATVALADSSRNIWDGSGPLEGGSDRYIGKAWCFGDSDFKPYDPQDSSGALDNTGPNVRPVICSGANVDNTTQTDSMTADISFRAEQSRNNPEFLCSTPPPTIPAN